ncbi:MAG TPA: hypothetical protein VHF89_04365 [Solirubrobacteraceae bacterium]|nr:hypothetical protein [Solirubrobacteraceae bacterium]
MATEEIGGLQVDLDRLPEDLRDLAPTIRRWAVGDEDEREQRQEAAATEDLADYWLTVSQRFPEINAYLEGQIEGERSPEALALSWTADGALEAAQVIERRTGHHPGGDTPAAA